MRKILLATTFIALLFALAPSASAGGVLGRPRSCCSGAPVAVYPFGYPYAYPYYPGAVFAPPVYGPSYFRPEAPYAWNAQRNWRDTWQDDGVKVHSYTFK